jgi:hypothetical protein
MATVDNRTRDAEATSQARLDHLVSEWRDESERRFGARTSVVLTETKRESPAHKRVTKSSPLRQIYVLTSRDIKTAVRDPLGFLASWTEAILLSLACGLIFLRLPRSLSGIRSREGALYTAVAMHPYIYVLYDIYRLTSGDMALFDRERGEGIIGVVPWMISRRISRSLLEDIITPFIFSAIYYFLCGLDGTTAKFFTFFGIMTLQHYIAVSLALLSAAVSRDFSVACLFANLIYTFQSFSSGYFIQAATLPVYVRWIKWIAYTVSVSITFAYNSWLTVLDIDSFMDSVL